jgi:hypothetical protein
MLTTRRNTTLHFANTCAGMRFAMYLGDRCAKHRWNNPVLFTRKPRWTVKGQLPDFMDTLTDDQPVKRVYRGMLFNPRFSRFHLPQRPVVGKGQGFLQEYSAVAERLGRGPQ